MIENPSPKALSSADAENHFLWKRESSGVQFFLPHLGLRINLIKFHFLFLFAWIRQNKLVICQTKPELEVSKRINV